MSDVRYPRAGTASRPKSDTEEAFVRIGLPMDQVVRDVGQEVRSARSWYEKPIVVPAALVAALAGGGGLVAREWNGGVASNDDVSARVRSLETAASQRDASLELAIVEVRHSVELNKAALAALRAELELRFQMVEAKKGRR